jgi:cytidylate kinase
MAEINDQPPPTPNANQAVWDLVMQDMRERDLVGRERYGTPLQAMNGRDPLIDIYQEALDLVVYLRQEIEERRMRRASQHSG